MNYNLLELDNLSEKEKEIALKILNDLSNGNSKSFNQLKYADFKEIPVDIETFITDDRYLGKAWKDSRGNLKLYPYWLTRLKELFPDNITTNYNNAIFTGARGLGKSEVAITCALYLMYRLMCLKDPHEYLHLKPTEKVAFAFMNITLTLAEEIGVTKFQSTVKSSPWFLERGTLSGRGEQRWNPPDWISIIVGSQASHVIGQPVYFCLVDEISFIKNQDIDKQKKIAIDIVDTAIGGMKTRFIHKGENPTLMILASSKRSEKSFLETHMKKKIADEESSCLIVDEAVWNVKPRDTYSGKEFKVGIGNRFLVSEIIPDNVDIKHYIDKGYKVINVPIEFKEDFKDDIDRALCDFAGVSSSDLIKYISGQRLIQCKRDNYKNAFIKDIIEVGNAKEDVLQYYNFFDLERIDPLLKSRPMFIHLDMSLSGDKTGIAGVWILGKKPHVDGIPDSKELYYKVAFSVSVKPPKGYQVSFEKTRQFIYWLRDQGFNIRGISSDTFQNADLAQQLKNQGFDYCIISVDRVNPESHVCEPYQYFKNSLYEERIELYDDCRLLTEEILGLEKNSSGKIDHPDEGRSGSKDQSDAVCGAIWNASRHSDEFEFEYGDTLSAITQVSSSINEEMKNQVLLNFEEELKNAHLFSSQSNQEIGLDFGRGKARKVNNNAFYLAQGIVCF